MIKREGAFRTDDANMALNHVFMQSCMYANLSESVRRLVPSIVHGTFVRQHRRTSGPHAIARE